MKKLLVVLFSVLCCACGKTDRIFDIDTQLYPVALETVELTGEKLPIEILGGYGIKVFDSLLFVSTLNPGNFRDVYSLESYSLLARLLRKGHANNEFLFNGYDGQCVEEDGCMNLYINDLNRQFFWKYNLTESVRQNKDCGEIIDVLPRHFLGAYYLAPHVFCYKNIMDDKCTYAIVDMAKHEVIEEFLVMNFVKERWQMDIPLAHNITKDNRVVVCYSLKINQLMLIDLKEKTRRSVSTSDVQPTWSQLETDFTDESKIYYVVVATTEREIYALYKGNPDNVEIHCFSQTGEFLKRISLKENIISFDVSDSYIYGLTTDEEIYRYKL